MLTIEISRNQRFFFFLNSVKLLKMIFIQYILKFGFYGKSVGGRSGKTTGSVRLRCFTFGRIVGRDGRTLRR